MSNKLGSQSLTYQGEDGELPILACLILNRRMVADSCVDLHLRPINRNIEVLRNGTSAVQKCFDILGLIIAVFKYVHSRQAITNQAHGSRTHPPSAIPRLLEFRGRFSG